METYEDELERLEQEAIEKTGGCLAVTEKWIKDKINGRRFDSGEDAGSQGTPDRTE